VSDRSQRPGGGLLASLIALALIGILAILPDLGPEIVSGEPPVQAHHGRIESIGSANPDEPYRPPFADVRILEGPLQGQVLEAYLEGPGGSQVIANYQPGDEVVVAVTQDASGDPYVAVVDRWRLPLLTLAGLLFAAAVVVVGRLRGLRALLALGLTIAVVLKVLVPLVIGGFAPVPLAVVVATLVTVITIVLTEGWTRASGAAILGTAAALALAGLLGLVGTSLAAFTYSAGSDLAFLQTADGRGLDLRGLLLAAFILGAVGVLDDVTVTQAALVERLAAGGVHGRELIAGAMAVGRSHIAATVNTLFLAYAGVGLPLLVTIVVSQQPAALVFNSEEVATEVIRTVVGSLGILAAVPLTTLFAAVLLDAPAGAGTRVPADRLRLLGGASLVIVLGLLATALLPLGAPRAALPVEVFSPSAGPGGPSESGGPGESGGPVRSDAPVVPESPGAGAGTPEPEPEVLLPGQVHLLRLDEATVEVSVIDLQATETDGGTRVLVTVSYLNGGPGDALVDTTAWGLLAVDGTDVPLAPNPDGGLTTGRLGPGDSRVGALVGSIPALPDETFVTYTDATGRLRFAVPLT
jgi:uncharacterized membrane protein